ncbi:MAG: hypothetical protein AAF479_02750 [Pseudomonadota bacterium]
MTDKLFTHVFNALTALVIVTFAMFVHTPVKAAIVTQGGTDTTGAGGFTIVGGASLQTVFHPFYNQTPTTPASEWIWDTAFTPNVTFEFGFDLSGHDVATASLNGLWGVDNFGEIALNGTQIAALPNSANTTGNFLSLHGFSVGLGSSLFQAGANLLTFSLHDLGAPGAFRAALTVEADPLAAVPLPAGAPLLLLALFGLTWVRSRRRGEIV